MSASKPIKITYRDIKIVARPTGGYSILNLKPEYPFICNTVSDAKRIISCYHDDYEQYKHIANDD